MAPKTTFFTVNIHEVSSVYDTSTAYNEHNEEITQSEITQSELYEKINDTTRKYIYLNYINLLLK